MTVVGEIQSESTALPQVVKSWVVSIQPHVYVALLYFTQLEFEKLGGLFLDNHRVTKIIPGDLVTIETNKGTFKARNVVIAAGPWAPTLCSSLGLHLPLKVLYYYSLRITVV